MLNYVIIAVVVNTMFIDKRIFDKYYREYIDGVNLDCIEFRTLSYNELQDFFRTYYYDGELDQPVFWVHDGLINPIGMHYLDFSIPYQDNKYILGIVDNNKGGKTIVFCMEYDSSYEIPLEEDKLVSYIIFVETNYYFREKGVLKRALEYIRHEFMDYSVLVMTSMSADGSKVKLFDRISNLFDDTGALIYENDYIYSLRKKKAIK